MSSSRPRRPAKKPAARRQTLLAGEAGERPERKTILYGVDPNPKKIRAYWESQGYGGPRGDLQLPVLRNEVDRTPNMLAGKPAIFPVKESKANQGEAWHYDEAGLYPVPVRSRGHHVPLFGRMQVARYGDRIEAAAKKHGVDPDLVKAIVFVENRNGYHYGTVAELFGRAETILPMNINVEMWQKLGIPAEDAMDPDGNVELGVRLIKKLVERVPGASPAQIGTLYNNLKAERVTDYGAQIQEAYDKQLWR